jgi:hypothetical protein
MRPVTNGSSAIWQAARNRSYAGRKARRLEALLLVKGVTRGVNGPQEVLANGTLI